MSVGIGGLSSEQPLCTSHPPFLVPRQWRLVIWDLISHRATLLSSDTAKQGNGEGNVLTHIPRTFLSNLTGSEEVIPAER